jgi:pyrrolysine biosynthesis protein PylC
MGGRLQGVEAAYLAQKAGWQVVLVDKDPDAPAVGICDSFRQFDLTDNDRLLELCKEVQFIIPALEDVIVLENICRCARKAGVKVVYDPQAYLLSSSKINSDKLFAALGIFAPKPWPFCDFPLTLKPSGASGSKNVYQVNSSAELDALTQKLDDTEDWVKQEFLEGPSYSIEVVGCNGTYQPFQVTELEIDSGYDCKRVLAPAKLAVEKVRQFEEIAVTIARKINLNGIMDVEVILHDDKLKVLEIDARLPSQTLTAVYKSTGVNVLEVLWSGSLLDNAQSDYKTSGVQGVIYEHIKVTGERLEVFGEHIMAHVGHLRLYENFFGADEAISNYREDKKEWVATLIVTGKDCEMAWERRGTVIKNIMDTFAIQEYRDLTPQTLFG